MNKLYKLLNKYSNGKNVLLLFILTQMVFAYMLTYTIPSVMSYANVMKILDVCPTGYSASYVKTLFDKLEPQGREVYLFRQLPLDMIYPLLFTISFSLLLTFLFKQSFNPKSRIFILSLLPILGGFFDYLENMGIITMLLIYPKFSVALANITNIFTLLKSGGTTLMYISLIIGVIALILNKFGKLKKNESI